MAAFLFVIWVTALYALVFNFDAVARVMRRTGRRRVAARAVSAPAQRVTRRARQR